MSDIPRLPEGDFNMPPGVRAADIPGNKSDFEFDVARTCEEICLRCQYEEHDLDEYLPAVIRELQIRLSPDVAASVGASEKEK